MSALTSLFDLLYPRTCAGCSGPVEKHDRYLCWNCRAGISVIAPPYCSTCGNPVEGRIDHAYICYHCADSTPHFDRARCATRYDGTIRNLIQDFKYNHALWLEDDLAEILKSCVEVHYKVEEIDAVGCVPLFPARQRARGFNQARLLAGALARSLRKPMLRRCLVRVRPTPTQTHLTARDRALNVKGAFEVRSPKAIEGKRLLIIDDVMTTGATLSECAHALKKAGAESVYMAALARGA